MRGGLVQPPERPLEAVIARRLDRRQLLAGAGGVFAGAALLRVLAELAPPAALAQSPGGLSPDDEAVEKTVAALADTVVPGPAGGADSEPGAVEAGAVEEAYDELYGISGTYPAIHADVQAATPLILGRPAGFDLELPYPDRERVLLDRITPSSEGGSSPLYLAYEALAIVVWFAYYGTARSRAGIDYIGVPPHSNGYWPDHGYQLRFDGMTPNGNPS